MPIQPSHHVSSQPSQNPDSRPANTQSLTAKSYFYETNPHQIERPPQAGLLYLTPVFQPGIPPRHKNVKRTQFHPAKIRNEPNFHVPLASRRLFQHQLCETNPIPVRARHAVPQKHETNPITAHPPNLHSTIYNIQSLGPIYPCPSLAHDPNMRNEPNLPPQQSKNAKRIQFPPRTHPTPLAEGQSRLVGKPNLSYRHHPVGFTVSQKYETNPISVPTPYRRHLASLPSPKYAKRTQFRPAKSQQPTANTQKMQSEPNPAHPRKPLTSVQ